MQTALPPLEPMKTRRGGPQVDRTLRTVLFFLLLNIVNDVDETQTEVKWN
jgi:hypothetical protein